MQKKITEVRKKTNTFRFKSPFFLEKGTLSYFLSEILPVQFVYIIRAWKEGERAILGHESRFFSFHLIPI